MKEGYTKLPTDDTSSLSKASNFLQIPACVFEITKQTKDHDVWNTLVKKLQYALYVWSGCNDKDAYTLIRVHCDITKPSRFCSMVNNSQGVTIWLGTYWMQQFMLGPASFCQALMKGGKISVSVDRTAIYNTYVIGIFNKVSDK